MATSGHFGLELQRVLPLWAEPLWANTLRENRDRKGKRSRRAEEEGERKEKKEGREREREVKAASRTICPGWPLREVGRKLRGIRLG